MSAICMTPPLFLVFQQSESVPAIERSSPGVYHERHTMLFPLIPSQVFVNSRSCESRARIYCLSSIPRFNETRGTGREPGRTRIFNNLIDSSTGRSTLTFSFIHASFSNIGFHLRRRQENFAPLFPYKQTIIVCISNSASSLFQFVIPLYKKQDSQHITIMCATYEPFGHKSPTRGNAVSQACERHLIPYVGPLPESSGLVLHRPLRTHAT